MKDFKLIPLLKKLIFASLCASAIHSFPSACANEYRGHYAPCPDGFKKAPLPNVCIALTLPGYVVEPLSMNNTCSNELTHLPGVPFCMATNVSLNIVNAQYLVAGPINKICPENFSRAPYSSICIANHLSLALVDHVLTLLAPTLNCPEAYEQLPGARTCTAIIDNTKPYPLPSLFEPECAPGFIKPPGEHFCLSFALALSTSSTVNYGITPPPGACPAFWEKRKTGGFCIPEYSLISCGATTFPCTQQPGDHFSVVKGFVCCPDNPSTTLGRIPAFDQHSALNFISKPIVMCGPPARGEPLACEAP